MKFCKDCKHYDLTIGCYCVRPTGETELVHGSKKIRDSECKEERRDSTFLEFLTMKRRCGKVGRYFEPKDTKK